jgi:hypothetical protein
MDLVIDTALEWWRAGGPRTRERLAGLVEHYADLYDLPRGGRAEAVARAWERALAAGWVPAA